jgi:hypothetical protein
MNSLSLVAVTAVNLQPAPVYLGIKQIMLHFQRVQKMRSTETASAAVAATMAKDVAMDDAVAEDFSLDGTSIAIVSET